MSMTAAIRQIDIDDFEFPTQGYPQQHAAIPRRAYRHAENDAAQTLSWSMRAGIVIGGALAGWAVPIAVAARLM